MALQQSAMEEHHKTATIDSKQPREEGKATQNTTQQNRAEPDRDAMSSASSEDEQEEPVINLGIPKQKPAITRPSGLLSNAQDLQARLASFLPQLAAANEDLAREGHGRNMEDVEDGQQHIEMNLGLGVLEEKGSSESESSSESETESDSESDDEESESKAGTKSEKRTQRKTDVMDKLMGQKVTKTKAAIEEVG